MLPQIYALKIKYLFNPIPCKGGGGGSKLDPDKNVNCQLF